MNQQIFSSLPEDYLKMTSMTSGYTEEYLKMNDESVGEGATEEMDEQNNNSASVIAAAAASNSASSSSPITVMIPVEGSGLPVEMIGMQNLPHRPQHAEEPANEQCHSMHYDNLDHMVTRSANGDSLKHHPNSLVYQRHHSNQPIQQTFL